MDDKQRIRPNMIYRTRGGWEAHVSDWGKNLMGEECWRGTELGIGLAAWDAAGKSLSGDERSDLVLEGGAGNDT